MKFYINKTKYFMLSVIPIVVMVLMMFKSHEGRDFTISSIAWVFPISLSLVNIFYFFKLRNKPFIELIKNGLILTTKFDNQRKIYFDDVISIKKNIFFGWKLTLLEGEVIFPLGDISKNDRIKIISLIKEHAKKNTY